PYVVERFGPEIPRYLERHQVRPGVSGWPQVNDLRGDTSIADRTISDIYYIENWSLAFDFKILLLPFGRTLFHKHAYGTRRDLDQPAAGATTGGERPAAADPRDRPHSRLLGAAQQPGLPRPQDSLSRVGAGSVLVPAESPAADACLHSGLLGDRAGQHP